MKNNIYRIIGALFLTCITNVSAISKEESDFFETKIRPVLIEHCYKCHSVKSEKIKGKLILDDKQLTLKGGSTGPAVVPGDLEKSLLITSIRYSNKDLQMPPSGKLSDKIIKDFETWVKNGAPDPRTESKTDFDWNKKAKEHWAYKPVESPSVPVVSSKWVSNPIDNYIFDNLRKNKLLPSPIDDKKVLIRRAYFDLIGLPPTETQLNAFLRDTSPSAYEKVIESLLSSPRYGERWGRHWLDTSRYSDTTGTINANQEPRYTYSYTYRDYVIRSFNEDKPFDQFIREQIAADKIPNIKRENLAALGFLTLGKNSNNNNDVIDDRIDVIFKGFMATTVVCARCHDHKFDPISTKDYYSIHGILNSSYVPSDNAKPLLKEIVETPEYLDYTKKREKIESEIEQFIDSRYASALTEFRTNTFKHIYGGYMLKSVAESNRTDYIRESQLNPRMIQRWAQSINVKIPMSKKLDLKGKTSKNKNADNPVFYPLNKMFNVPPTEFQQIFSKMIQEESDDINPYLLHQLKRINISTFRDLATAYQNAVLDSLITKTNITGVVEFQDVIYRNNGPLDISRDSFQRYYSDNGKTMRYDNELRQQRGKLITHELTHIATPARAMAIVDKDKPIDSQVLIKGDPGTRGPTVQRKFIELLNFINPNTFTNGSGRLELANCISDKRNPLTARVMVNRLWHFHFGEGIVKTPDDFGVLTDTPVQYELLNYLAWRFMNDGWSVKNMHRLIMTSSTYMQSSSADYSKLSIDPYNKYYWRMNITKLDFETLRDTILFIGGKLDVTMGGQSVNLVTVNDGVYSNRRTVYGLVDRSRLPEMFTTFDFATPEMTTGKRFQTTVPKQALFLMNNPLVIEQVRNLISRPEFINLKTDEEKIHSLYAICFQRVPIPTEVKIATKYMQSANMEDMSDIKKEYHWKYGYRVLDSTKSLSKLFEFNSYEKETYFSSNNLNGMTITRNGGKLPTSNVYVSRQWISPREGSFQVDVNVKLKSKLDNANLVILRNDKVIHGVAITNNINGISIKLDINNIKPKEKFDFCMVNSIKKESDYIIDIKISELKDENSLTPVSWNSTQDFRGPIRKLDRELDSWERYAHILLLSNEMVFIN